MPVYQIFIQIFEHARIKPFLCGQFGSPRFNRDMTIIITDQNTPVAQVIPLVQDERLKEILAGLAQRAGVDAATLQQDFRAEPKEGLILYPAGQPDSRLYLLGLGKKCSFSDLQAAFRSFSHRFKAKLPQNIGIDLRQFPVADIPRLTEAVLTGISLGLYEIGRRFRTGTEDKPVPEFSADHSQVTILVPSEAVFAAHPAIQRAQAFAGAAKNILDLMNAPGNFKTPLMLADWVTEQGRECGFKVRTVHVEDIEKEGLGALYAVGKGSPNPPVLLLLEYGEKSASTPVFGLVGKGITFDTGGISLKPSANMHYMKSDMGGAAAVLGAFMVAAQLKLPVRLIGAIPAAENMVDGIAVKPGDVITTYSGKTVEVTDTDAEGRLVLADALAYLLKEETPGVLIDLATLTGSIIRAIGTQAAGLFTSSDELAAALTTSGDACGERLWRMPMWEEYGSDLKSDVADLRNYTGKPMAESISAAKFLEHFTAAHPVWAHLDIAGMAFADSEFAQTKSATAYGIRLLTEFVEHWTATHSSTD